MPGGSGNRNISRRGRRSATSVAFLPSLPRRYSSCTVSPGSSPRASSTSLLPGPDSSSSSALAPASEVPLNFVMMSPTLSPALAAGPPGVTPSILAPILSVSESASLLTTTPIRPRLSLNEYANPRGSRGGRGVPCAASAAGQAASAAAAITVHLCCIVNAPPGSEPHVAGPGNPDAHELLHQVHPLLPEFQELGGAGLGRTRPRQLAIDGGNPVFQGGRERR